LWHDFSCIDSDNFLFYLYKKILMRLSSFSVLVLLIHLLFCFNGFSQNQTAQVKPVSSTTAGKSASSKPTAPQAQINWISFEEAIERNKKKPKKIFIDAYTDWCGWCKVMDKQTFTDPIIIEYINANFYAVKFDAESKNPITFKGRTYQFVPSGNRGYHELAAELMNNRMSYPTVVFLDENMDLLQPIPGFVKPAELDIILKYF
jgi:thioredoxin-related protein